MIAPTAAETGEIVRRMEPELARFADQYEERKYPRTNSPDSA